MPAYIKYSTEMKKNKRNFKSYRFLIDIMYSILKQKLFNEQYRKIIYAKSSKTVYISNSMNWMLGINDISITN